MSEMQRAGTIQQEREVVALLRLPKARSTILVT